MDSPAGWSGFSLVLLSQTVLGPGLVHVSLTRSGLPAAPKSLTIFAFPSSLGLKAVTRTLSEESLSTGAGAGLLEARAARSGWEQETPNRAASSGEKALWARMAKRKTVGPSWSAR